MKHKLFTLFVLLALLLALTPARPARAAFWTVNTLTDENDHSCIDGDCSLRDAVELSGSADTIQFSVVGTIALASPITLSKNLTISGPDWNNLTLSGGGSNRIFLINSGKVISISGLTIANGSASYGAGIYNNGSLTVTGCLFYNNQAASGSGGGGIANSSLGWLYVYDSTFSENTAEFGGGVYNESYAEIHTSLFSMNQANSMGGALYNSHEMVVQDSTLDGNHAPAGGAIGTASASSLDVSGSTFEDNNATSNSGGGIYGYSASVSITNSTFENNTAISMGGAVYSAQAGATLTVTNSTFSGNSAGVAQGAGIHNTSSATLNYTNTILAYSLSGLDCVNYATLGTNLNNLAQSGNCSATYSANPNLDVLEDNGGPTQTMALLPGSPAIDTGDDTNCPATDQRGVDRFKGSHCDIGAYEVDNSAPTDIALSNNTVLENQPVGTNIGTLTTTDPDVTDTHTYSFACTVPGADDASFARVGSALNTAAVFDYETKNAYNICIRTDDGYGGIYDENFTIHVTDLVESTSTFRSTGTQDGWILETGENTTKGGTTDSASTTLRLGDDSAKKQYRSILSFATGATLPDNAVITKVTLKVKKQGITGGGNPVTIFQGFMADIKKGMFGTFALQATDFQAGGVHTYGPFTTALAGGWYTIDLTAGKAYINKLATGGGLTQIRLRFKLDDNNNTVANYLSLYSGDAATASRPQLIIEYYIP